MTVKFKNAFTNRPTCDFEELDRTELLVDTSDYISITDYCLKFGILPKPVEVVEGDDHQEIYTEKDLGDFNYSKPSQEDVDLLNQELNNIKEKQEQVEDVEKSQVADIATNQQPQVASPSTTSQLV